MKIISSILETSRQNMFISYLKILGVRHNNTYTSDFYHKHPHKHSLYGLYLMLQDYGIESVSLKVKNKKKVIQYEPPFIAQLTDNFVIVSELTDDSVEYIMEGKKIRSSLSSFEEIWTGVILIAQANKNSEEPEFRKHRKDENIRQTKNLLLLCLTLTLCIGSYIIKQSYTNNLLNSLLILNITGLYITFLLILKQLHIDNRQADKICSFLHRYGCNKLLSTPDSNLWGIVSWSELGLGYFVSNLIIILFVPELLEYLILLNLLTLPYSLWSVWYQKFRAHQFCTLCLITQAIFWLMSGVCLIIKGISIPGLMTINSVCTGIIYLFPYLTISHLLSIINKARQQEKSVQYVNNLRMREEVFCSLLKNQPHYDVSSSDSLILFGNPQARLKITILSNPHCDPCARIHKEAERLIHTYSNDMCFQYIFSSFGKNFHESNFFLLSTYLHHKHEYTQKIYNEWFQGNDFHKKELTDKYRQTPADSKVQDEFTRHQNWIEKTKLSATPTILINGYSLPKEYSLEDMKFFVDIHIDAN